MFAEISPRYAHDRKDVQAPPESLGAANRKIRLEAPRRAYQTSTSLMRPWTGEIGFLSVFRSRNEVHGTRAARAGRRGAMGLKSKADKDPRMS